MKLTATQFIICAHQITKLPSYCMCKPTADLHLQFLVVTGMLYDLKQEQRKSIAEICTFWFYSIGQNGVGLLL